MRALQTCESSGRARADFSQLTDRELVAAPTDGDNLALAAICERYRSELGRQIRRILGPGAPFEEITQDVFVRFWSTAARFDPDRATLRAYLHLIAKGKALDWVRSESARRQRELNYGRPPVADGREVAEIRSAVDSLPPRERRAIWLAYYVGFTYRQVAAILDIPEGTAKAQVSSALRRLHVLLVVDRNEAAVIAGRP